MTKNHDKTKIINKKKYAEYKEMTTDEGSQQITIHQTENTGK